ncbi:hypothetical protein LINGRAHAP2_LOCUS12725 [Linum grandiflorum]
MEELKGPEESDNKIRAQFLGRTGGNKVRRLRFLRQPDFLRRKTD